DPMLELRADFTESEVTILGSYSNIVAVDSICLCNTNAERYTLSSRAGVHEGEINGRITIHNFANTIYIPSFNLKLRYGDNGRTDPLYLGYLFLGRKTELPRFGVQPEYSLALTGQSSRSFGGQVFGMRRKTLETFSVNFPRLTAEERNKIIEYVQAVQNTDPHIIDPYPEAGDMFPPMYVTLDIDEVSLTKQHESGFYYSSSLAWKEAR
ncbi:MAG TPA: hypothetical protein DEQ14_03060, partial [Treponema sp.]|nr:hypothetical protein [Treponema sp.]